MPSERIQLLIDVVKGNSSRTLATLKTDLAAADGAGAKLKVGTKALGDAFKQNLGVIGPAAAATAAAAIAKLLVKAGGDFQKLALRVGEFRDATGLAAEDASRFVELAGDLGIPVDTLQTAIGRLNRAAADTPEAFADIGAQIAVAKDGTTDVNQTFLNTIDALNAMPDATKRSAAAFKIFGRGWAQISEIVGSGADDLKARLEGVGEGQIVTDGQIAEARRFRDNLDDLNDGVEQVFNSIGSGLIPVLNDLIGVAQSVGAAISAIPFKDQAVEIAGWVTGIKPATMLLSGLNQELSDFRGVTHGSIGAMASYKGELSGTELQLAQFEAAQKRASEATKDQYESASEAVGRLAALEAAQQEAAAEAQANADAMRDAAEASREQAEAFRSAADATYAQRDAHRDAAEAAAHVQEVIDDEESTMGDLAKALDDAALAAGNAADSDVRLAKERATARGETVSATRELGLFNQSLIEQAAQASGPTRAAIVDYIATVNNIPPEKASEILALIDEGKLDTAQRRLNKASEAREATITADAETAAAQRELDALDNPRTMDLIVNPRLGGPIPRFASGGTTSSSGMALVGEQGPELVALPGGAHISTAAQTRALLSRRQRRAVRSNLGVSENLADQAAAMRALAEAATDAEEKERLLDQANDLMERSANRAARASQILADRYGAEADALRRRADALRENAAAFADAQRERASSRQDAVSARLALEDERASAAEALAHAGRAFTTEGVSAAQRAAAVNDAQQAALSLANAAAERAREQAEAASREFTDADAARARQKAIEDLAKQGGPVGAAMKALLRELNFPDQIRRLEAAAKREEKAEAAADKNEKTADKFDKASARFERISDNAADAFAGLLKAFGKGLLTQEQLDREIDKALAKIARGARGGRR